MDESQETEKTDSEKWESVSPEEVELDNDVLRDNGASYLECFNRALVIKSLDQERRSQLTIALSYSMSHFAVAKLKPEQPEIEGMALFGGMRGDDLVLYFGRPRGEPDDKTVQDITSMVKNTNELLRAFGKPGIPPFTLKD